MITAEQLVQHGLLRYASSNEMAYVRHQSSNSVMGYTNLQRYWEKVMQGDLSTVVPETYDAAFSSEELNLYYAYLRKHLIGDAYSLFEVADITSLPPTEHNCNFILDPQVEAEQIVEGCLIRSKQLASGYPDIFKNYSNARGVPFLALSACTPFKSNNWDLEHLAGRTGELEKFREYYEIQKQELTILLGNARRVWQEKESGLISSIAQVVGLDEKEYSQKPKHILGTRIPWGSYFYFNSQYDKPEYPYVYSKDNYPSFITVPLKDAGLDSSQAYNIITEELVHLEILEVADKLPHNIKEAVMTATLTQIFNKAGDTAYTFWMANDWSRRMAGGAYQSLQKYLEPIYQGRSTVQEVLSQIYGDYQSGELFGYVNKT